MEKNMKENFEKLEGRVYDALYNSDLERINYELSKVDKPTLVTGVGGSSVVSEFASKVLSERNNIITRNTEPRDLNYINKDLYSNILVCSYTGKNYGVALAYQNELKHYLLSSKPTEVEGVTNLTYSNSDKEKSFISLAATLAPCAVLYNYYMKYGNDYWKIIDNLDSYSFDFDTNCDAYEIFSGIDSSVCAKFLESTMIEAGIGVPIIHDKYSYCHGRSTLCTNMNNNAILFSSGTDLDKIYLEELKKHYHEVIVFESNGISNEFYNLQRCMYLTKYIAESKNKDLSGVDYNPIVRKLYRFKGEM